MKFQPWYFRHSRFVEEAIDRAYYLQFEPYRRCVYTDEGLTFYDIPKNWIAV